MASKSIGIPKPVIITYGWIIQVLRLQQVGKICLPSALISLGPQAQMDDVGKFASARTIKKRNTVGSVNEYKSTFVATGE